MDEGMHIRGVEIVFLVPGRCRQHDVGIEAAGRHAEIKRDHEVELALRGGIAPGHLTGLLASHLAEILALEAVTRAKEMAQEVFVPLARRAEQVRAPDEQIAWEVLGLIRILASHPQPAVLQTRDDMVFHGGPGFFRFARDRKSTRLNSSHLGISYAVFCLKKKTKLM